MKIYFSGSIRGGRQDAELYKQLIEHLKQYGSVLTEHIGYKSITDTKTDRAIHDEDMAWLRESDIVVAEVTTPSLGVGYEIGRAVEMGKKILCLYRKTEGKDISAMLKGSPDLNCRPYRSIKEATTILSKFIKE